MIDDYTEIEVPPGKLAEIVTHLEMRAAPAKPAPADGPWRLERRAAPDLDWYLALYHDIGGPWLWYSRLLMPKDAVRTVLDDPGVEVYALVREGREVGIGELSFRTPGEAEISFFGVAASEIGAGAGRWMMAKLLERAWAEAPRRVWLHTCTLDHPNALPFYIRQGFRPYRRTVGLFADPRLSGALAPTDGPHIPVIRPDAGEAGG